MSDDQNVEFKSTFGAKKLFCVCVCEELIGVVPFAKRCAYTLSTGSVCSARTQPLKLALQRRTRQQIGDFVQQLLASGV